MDDRRPRLDLTTAGRPARRSDDLRVGGAASPRPAVHAAPQPIVQPVGYDADRHDGRRSDDVESVSRVRTEDEHAGSLSALADPVRRRILDIIGEDGPQSASMLAKHFDISRQAVLKHLVTLEDARLVRRMPRGRSVLFVIDGESLVVTSQWLSRTVAGWALGRTSSARPAAAGTPETATATASQAPSLRVLR